MLSLERRKVNNGVRWNTVADSRLHLSCYDRSIHFANFPVRNPFSVHKLFQPLYSRGRQWHFGVFAHFCYDSSWRIEAHFSNDSCSIQAKQQAFLKHYLSVFWNFNFLKCRVCLNVFNIKFVHHCHFVFVCIHFP